MARKSSTNKKTVVKGRPPRSKAAKPAQKKSAQRRKISAAELRKIINAHEKWLDSDGKKGEQAQLHHANLQGAKLFGANLQGADLFEANLQGAYLFRANLQGADLREVKAVTASQIKRARNWQLAFYSDDFVKELGLPTDHNETILKKFKEIDKEKEKAATSP